MRKVENHEPDAARDGSGVRPSSQFFDPRTQARRPRLEAFGMSDRGRARERNEDQFLIGELERSLLIQQSSVGMTGTSLSEAPQGSLFIVADGMGGYGHGEVASSVAVEALARYAFALMPWLLRHEHATEAELERALEQALQHCHRAVQQTAQREGYDRRMGTTLTLAYVTWPELHIAHAGDSRAYLLRGAELRRLTRDHTLAEQLLEAEALTPDEARRSRFRHVLVNAVGGSATSVRVDLCSLELAEGDVLLLCSDGLTTHVSDEILARQLGKRAPVEYTVRELVDAANAAGGSDNITVVAARF